MQAEIKVNLPIESLAPFVERRREHKGAFGLWQISNKNPDSNRRMIDCVEYRRPERMMRYYPYNEEVICGI